MKSVKVLEENRIFSRVRKPPPKTVNSGSHEGEDILNLWMRIYHKIKIERQVMGMVFGMV